MDGGGGEAEGMANSTLTYNSGECDTLEARLVLAAAKAFIGVTEEGGENRGQMVRTFLESVHLKEPNPWCLAFVYYVGYRALLNVDTNRSLWPLPSTGGCAWLGEWAAQHTLLLKTPQPGDVFLLYSTRKQRLAHAGFIVKVNTNGTVQTIEGNTNEQGSREGGTVMMKTRPFSAGKNDRVIRWTHLLQSQQAVMNMAKAA